MSQVVVVGAGVGGLACAIRLAATGHQVTVFEQADRVGGKLHSYEADGFRFDTGPGLLTLPQVFDELFDESTVDWRRGLVRLDPVVRHVFADGAVLDSTSDAVAMLARVADAFGPAAGRDWTRLWARAERVWTASWRHVLRSTMDSPARLLPLAWHLRDVAAVRPGGTLRGVRLGEEHLRMLLDRYATYAGADPRRAPAALVSIPYAELTYGGWYLRGGLATLADRLGERCAELGVRIHTDTPVAAIEAGSGRVRGVRLAGGTLVEASTVVANADAAAVYRDLLATPRRARRLSARSPGGFVLLLGVRGRTPGLAHHTVFFPRDYDAEFDAVFGGRPATDPAVYVSVPDDPAVRPDGHEAWFVLVNAPPQGAFDWRADGVADAYADRVLAVLADRGLDVRDRVVLRVVRTPADLQEQTWTPGGAIYGTPGHGLLRPGNHAPVRGLYLVGGSTHPGGGLPMVARSGLNVAAAIGERR